MTHTLIRPTLGLLLLITLPGCAQLARLEAYEPYNRPGTWTVEGSNQANLAAQVVNPGDLVRGRSDPSPHYKQAAAAVTTLWTAKPTQALLPGLKGGGAAPAGASVAPAAP